MRKLAVAVNQEMGKERTLIYFEQLRFYTIDEIQIAVNRAIKEETYNVIPTVGKLIAYIEEERGIDYWPKLEYRGEWPEISDERLKELTKPFYDKLNKTEESLSEEDRERRWNANKDNLKKQLTLMKNKGENCDSIKP